MLIWWPKSDFERWKIPRIKFCWQIIIYDYFDICIKNPGQEIVTDGKAPFLVMNNVSSIFIRLKKELLVTKKQPKAMWLTFFPWDAPRTFSRSLTVLKNSCIRANCQQKDFTGIPFAENLAFAPMQLIWYKVFISDNEHTPDPICSAWYDQLDCRKSWNSHGLHWTPRSLNPVYHTHLWDNRLHYKRTGMFLWCRL